MRVPALCLGIGGVQRILCEGVDFALQVNDGNPWLLAYMRLKTFRWHGSLLPGTQSIRLCDDLHRC